jgi:endonuclease G
LAVTPNLRQAVDKATARATKLEAGGNMGLQEIADSIHDKTPEQLNSSTEMDKRREFLDSLYDTGREAQQAFERIINGNELQDANFLPRGALVSRAVLRVVVRAGARVIGYGTGFLVGEGVLITNHHVLQSADIARNSLAEAFFQYGLAGEDEPKQTFTLDVDKLFFTDENLDFTVVALSPRSDRGALAVADLGWLPLIGTTGKVMDGEWLTIVQHPEGERKQVCVRENQLIKRDDDVLWYSTDTLGGSSGSPVFNNDWLVVALHHSGVPETKNDKWQTVDGRDYDSTRDSEASIKWIANEGIRVSRIVQKLSTEPQTAKHPLVAAVVGVGIDDVRARLPIMTREGAQLPNALSDLAAVTSTTGAGPGGASSNPPTERSSTETSMATRLINLTLAVDDGGNVSVQDQSAKESFLLEAAAVKPKKNIIMAPVDPATDWKGGYDPNFLTDAAKPASNLIVPLPTVLDRKRIAPLLDPDPYTQQQVSQNEQEDGVLRYKGYSVVMNKDRCFALFSAANVNGGMRSDISGRNDAWLFDERIDRKYQIDNSYYAHDKFDRGHLTRREDMEWGTDPKDAVNRANGTCTWTNCTPQHEVFNQGKDPSVQLWAQLEHYILEESAKFGHFKAQVITGPIFGSADPEYRDIAYPLEFWKVVAAVATDKKGNDHLFATAYVLGQKATIAKFGLEEALEVPFGEFGTYQRPISLIENLTGLRFTYGNKLPLSGVDPLAAPDWRPKVKSSAAGPNEAFGVAQDDALQSLDDIILR